MDDCHQRPFVEERIGGSFLQGIRLKTTWPHKNFIKKIIIIWCDSHSIFQKEQFRVGQCKQEAS